MKKLILSTFLILGVFSFAKAQVFELQNTDPKVVNKNTDNSSSVSSEDGDIIVDKTSDDGEVIIDKTPQVDTWMNTVQSHKRDYALIEKTLKNGQNPNQSIFDGSSMLHLAAWQNDEQLFRLGLKYGGQINKINNNGETVLHWAAYSNNPNIIKMALADKNIQKIINKQNKKGRTPLHFNALQWGNLEVAKSLILKGADLNIKDINGQTPLDYALALRKWDLAKLYIDSGADLTLKDNNGKGINEYIMENGDLEAFKLFYKYLTPENQSILKSRLYGLDSTFN